MSQASYGLSLSHADCNEDRGQAHFDATLDACGVAVLRLINSSPRTPMPEEITELIRDTLRNGFNSPEAVALHDEIGRSENPDDALDFEAVPVSFQETNDEFTRANLPWIRLGITFLNHDRDSAVAAVRKMIADGNGQLVDEMQDAWEVVGAKFEALSAMLETVRARLEVARRCLEGEAR